VPPILPLEPSNRLPTGQTIRRRDRPRVIPSSPRKRRAPPRRERSALRQASARFQALPRLPPPLRPPLPLRLRLPLRLPPLLRLPPPLRPPRLLRLQLLLRRLRLLLRLVPAPCRSLSARPPPPGQCPLQMRVPRRRLPVQRRKPPPAPSLR